LVATQRPGKPWPPAGVARSRRGKTHCGPWNCSWNRPFERVRPQVHGRLEMWLPGPRRAVPVRTPRDWLPPGQVPTPDRSAGRIGAKEPPRGRAVPFTPPARLRRHDSSQLRPTAEFTSVFPGAGRPGPIGLPPRRRGSGGGSQASSQANAKTSSEPILCGHCWSYGSNGIRASGFCVADGDKLNSKAPAFASCPGPLASRYEWLESSPCQLLPTDWFSPSPYY